MEHRWGERLPVDWAVRLLLRKECIPDVRLKDVSLSGSGLQTNAALRVFAQVELLLLWPHSAYQAPARLEAIVVRRAGSRIGLEWLEFASPPILKLIRALQAQRALAVTAQRGAVPKVLEPERIYPVSA
jgi:hypothetical protein